VLYWDLILMDSLYAAIPIAPPAPLGERNIEAFILPLAVDEVSCYPDDPDRQENRKPSRRKINEKCDASTAGLR
jgi:hypothetical protein